MRCMCSCCVVLNFYVRTRRSLHHASINTALGSTSASKFPPSHFSTIYLSIFQCNEERKAMDVFSPPTTRLALKWVSLCVTLLLLLQWGTPTVDAREGIMYGEGLQQQRRSCDPERLSQCRDYMERRREQPSERCCEELERMSPQCRCRAIQQVLDQSQSYDSTREDLFMDTEAEERAAYLPETCNVRQPPRRCHVQRRSRYFTTGSGF